MLIFRPCQTSSNAICSCQPVSLITKCNYLLLAITARVDKKNLLTLSVLWAAKHPQWTFQRTFLLPAVNSVLMEKRRKGFCPLWRTCVLWLDGCQSCQHTNFLKIPRLWDGFPLSAPWVVNLQLCQEQLSRDLLAAGLIVGLWDSELFFSFFF